MSSMKKILEDELDKQPRQFLRKALKNKLKEQGVKDEDAIEAFTDHVLSGDESTFIYTWDDGPLKRIINITFTEQDGKTVLEEMNKWLEEVWPKIVSGSIKDGAKAITKTFEKGWPTVKLNKKYASRHFSDRIDLRWSKGLDPLRMMLIASCEVGEMFTGKLQRSKAKKGLLKRQALTILHRRACRTTHEILTLIENGFPDGAYARWRTLYEITVVAFFLSRHGDGAAKRYLDHDVVSTHETLVNKYKFVKQQYDPDKLEGRAREIEENFQAAVQTYGPAFAGHYGWAADSLSKKNPRFQDLEQEMDWGVLPPEYKHSSFMVHAGITGALRTLDTIGGDRVIRSSATNAGLDTPAIKTASSLLQITALIFPNPNQLETIVQMQSLIFLRDKVVKECRKAARKLESDELKIRAD